jgi:hypothetical protein
MEKEEQQGEAKTMSVANFFHAENLMFIVEFIMPWLTEREFLTLMGCTKGIRECFLLWKGKGLSMELWQTKLLKPEMHGDFVWKKLIASMEEKNERSHQGMALAVVHLREKIRMAHIVGKSTVHHYFSKESFDLLLKKCALEHNHCEDVQFNDRLAQYKYKFRILFYRHDHAFKKRGNTNGALLTRHILNSNVSLWKQDVQGGAAAAEEEGAMSMLEVLFQIIFFFFAS